MSRKPSNQFSILRRAFSFIEMLVVIAIIAVLIGLIVPAILQGVESARRVSCQNNLRQMCMALDDYTDAKGHFPPAFLVVGQQSDGISSPSWGWAAMLLPFLDEEPLYQNAGVGRLPFGGGTVPAPANSWTQTELAVFRCPSDTGPALNSFELFHATSNYRAVAGPGLSGDMVQIGVDWGGVIYPNSKVALADVTDGLSNTIVLGECSLDVGADLPAAIWAGYAGITDANNSNNYGFLNVLGTAKATFGIVAANINVDAPDAFSSRHPGGALFAFCDGSVRFLRQDMDPQVLIRLSWRNDGVAVNVPDD